MQTIDLYTTPQCGFCTQLKSKMDSEGIVYTMHDVAEDGEALKEMQTITNGVMSVPVLILNKGMNDQKASIGFIDGLQALQLSQNEKSQNSIEIATLTCPNCGHRQQGEIPISACVPFYICAGCSRTIESLEGDCCVFCSHADKPCPLKETGGNCSDGICTV